MTITNNTIQHYKNFNMGTELDIAGDFIYDGINKMEQMIDLENISEIFSFLYHISVGIERLQKVLIVLIENITPSRIDEFEKSLITHSHQTLNKRITIHSSTNISFTPMENSFLQILDNFYKKCRYNRFNVFGDLNQEKEILKEFVVNKLNQPYENIPFNQNYVSMTEKVKEQFGRIIGSISKKYYHEINENARKQNIYTYELKAFSKAESVFLASYEKKSLHEMKTKEKIAIKELLIYLMTSDFLNDYLPYLKEVTPLEFDPALISEYLSDIIDKNKFQNLVSEVYGLYDLDVDNPKERMELVQLLGNPNVYYNYDEYDYEE